MGKLYEKIFWFFGEGLRAKIELEEESLWDKVRYFIWIRLPSPK